VDHGPGGQLVDLEEMLELHVVQLGDAKRAVSGLDPVGLHAGFGNRLGGLPGNLEDLVDGKIGAFQTVKLLNLVGGGAVTPGNDPQGIAAFDDMFGGHRSTHPDRGFGRCARYDHTLARDLDAFPRPDKMTAPDIVGPQAAGGR